jgi:cytosine/uracil/thiamine/allantoin permease
MPHQQSNNEPRAKAFWDDPLSNFKTKIIYYSSNPETGKIVAAFIVATIGALVGLVCGCIFRDDFGKYEKLVQVGLFFGGFIAGFILLLLLVSISEVISKALCNLTTEPAPPQVNNYGPL